MGSVSNDIPVRVIRSSRKTLSVEIKPDLSVIVRAPQRCREADIRRFLAEREDWIRQHLEQQRKRQEALQESLQNTGFLSDAEIRALGKQAMQVIPEKAEYYAGLVGVSYGRITIRMQKTRWGSCSAQGNLNFNCLLMLAPEDVIDYVVVHELCHRREMNHSQAFWQQVERVLPDYKERKKWLKDHGAELMARGGR